MKNNKVHHTILGDGIQCVLDLIMQNKLLVVRDIKYGNLWLLSLQYHKSGNKEKLSTHVA